MQSSEDTTAEERIIYDELVMEKAAYLMCDNCGHFPIRPVHGHFICPACHMPTKCCEGAPLDV